MSEHLDTLRSLAQAYRLILACYPARDAEIQAEIVQLQSKRAQLRADFDSAPEKLASVQSRLERAERLAELEAMPRTPRAYRSPMDEKESLKRQLERAKLQIQELEAQLRETAT